MSRLAEMQAERAASERFFDEPATGVELELHTLDGCIARIRSLVGASPWLAGAYRDELAQLSSDFTRLADGQPFQGTV